MKHREIEEHRKFSRVDFATQAVVQGKTLSATGAVENLSLNGMLLKSNTPFRTGEALDITIFLSGISPELSFNLRGLVVRRLSEGVAIQFDMKDVDVDAIVHLRNIVGYNLGDLDVVMEEFLDFIHSN